MSTSLKIFYACSEVPAKSFSCLIPKDNTCENLLQKISKLQNANYIALFYEGFQIDSKAEISDFWKGNEIFYASTTGTPPTTEFLNNVKVDITCDLNDLDSVKQIVMVNLDESESMACDLDGHVIKNSNKDHRVTIAIQYLTIFINRIYGLQVQSIQGLISFNNQIKIRCPLSPHVSDFEDKGLKNIKPESIPKLWESLVCSCDEIIKFRKDNNGNENYKNAQSRILVISSDDDNYSEVKVEDLVKKLIKNKIIVDSIIISSEDCCKMLCAVCHATGGFSFKPESVSQGISLFEKSAFLNIEKRKSHIDPLIPDQRNTTPLILAKNLDMITTDLMNEAQQNAEFDTKILDNEMIITRDLFLVTPRHHCVGLTNEKLPNLKRKRILTELYLAAEQNDSSTTLFDPDIKIYTSQTNIDRWNVYIKGPADTPFENKWWYLYVSFPDLYPDQPPIFRFVSVPYHINISSDGEICLNSIGKDYMLSMHVADLIQDIKQLLLFPNSDDPIRIETYDLYMNNRDKYDNLARESAEKNGKDSVEDYIGSTKIKDEVPEDFRLDNNILYH